LAISPKIKIIFLANKSDLSAQLKFGEKEFADMATAFHVPYCFTSAKTGFNVDIAFNILGKMILNT
jgi:putative ribosome biogenesis GTPase RsgA